MRGSFIELATVSQSNLSGALEAVGGYLKVASMLWIRALREPILDGVVITEWSRAASTAFQKFCRKHGVSEVLLRVDRHASRWSTRRGGYILPAREVRRTVRELSREGFIAVLLEPLSPYKDRYCLACVSIPREDRVVVEIVGPGFDTSDLLRSDVLPHERFEIEVPLGVGNLQKQPTFAYKRTHIVSQPEYQQTVDERLTKIGARLISPAFPKQQLESDNADRARLKESALAFLRRNRETALLRNLENYRPIPARYLFRFVRGTLHMLAGLARHDVRLGSTTFSGTVTTAGRFMFWDFFPADAGEAKMLYKSR